VTGAEFSGVDVDLLADYVGGALDGTPDEPVVAALIADDPAWRDAYDALARSMATVGAQLNEWGTRPEPMPAEVAARLDAVFAGRSAVADPAPIDAGLAAPARPHLVPAGGGVASDRHLSAVPESGVGKRERTTVADRRRRLRWAVPVAAAAGVIAFLGLGVGYLSDRGGSSNAAATSSKAAAGSVSAESAPMMASEPDGRVPAGALPAGGLILASGTDYQRATLGTSVPRPLIESDRDAGTPSAKGSSPAAAVAGQAGTDLQRLAGSDALRACLDAITGENGAGPIAVLSVDYARYESRPALVVRFTASNGGWAWASGADCGAPGFGSAKLAAVKVG
jgi:hypothetical protein